MIKTITDKNQYQLYPILETNVKGYNLPVKLFGKEWMMMDDYWMKHVHIKVTDMCDAHCPFCIEKGSHVVSDPPKLLTNVAILLHEMNKSGNLCTVSITGGEPMLFPHFALLIEMIKQYDCFLTVNTNFNYPAFFSKKDIDYLNISRHKIGKDHSCGLPELDKKLIEKFRDFHKTTKVRIQCVLHENGLQSVDDFLNFVRYYRSIADDISIRRLITTEGDIDDNDLYTKIKQYCFEHAEFVEQVLKDYYVYETWNLEGINVTFSHSNMALLKSMEEVEPDNLIREIVVHPDGMISGSWYRDRKIIEK